MFKICQFEESGASSSTLACFIVTIMIVGSTGIIILRSVQGANLLPLAEFASIFAAAAGVAAAAIVDRRVYVATGADAELLSPFLLQSEC